MQQKVTLRASSAVRRRCLPTLTTTWWMSTATVAAAIVVAAVVLPSSSSVFAFAADDASSSPEVEGPHRSLTNGGGDFADLNALLSSAAVSLPSVSVSQGINNIRATNVVCRSFSVGDVKLNSVPMSGNTVRVTLEVDDLDAACTFNYNYEGMLFFRGGGWADVKTYDNAAQVILDLSTSSPSQPLSKHTPSQVTVVSCVPRASIHSMVFHGGIEGFILNALEGMLRQRIADEMGKKMCQELREWSAGGAKEMLDRFGGMINGYISEGWGTIDPLWSEKAMMTTNPSSKGAELLEWNDPDGNVGKLLKRGLDEGSAYLRSLVPDPTSSSKPKVMNANLLLREHALTPEGELDVVLKDLPFLSNGNDVNGGTLLWEGTDRLASSSVSLTAMRIRGLDTLERFDPLDVLGSHTLRSRLAWSSLSFELDLVVSVRASTLPDSVIRNPGDVPPIAERVTVRFALRDVEADAALLLAVDENRYGDVHLASLLRTASALPCLLTGVHDLRLSSLSASVGSVSPPTLDGFVSPGLDRLGGAFAETFAKIYTGTMLKAAPGFFRGDVREMAEGWIRTSWTEGRAGRGECLSSDGGAGGGVVDLRDLLLPPSEAVASGASGASPYGDVVSSHLITLIRDEVLAPSQEDGLPLINSRLVRPLTEWMSGAPGRVDVTALDGMGYTYEKKNDEDESQAAEAATATLDDDDEPFFSSLAHSFHVGLSSTSVLNLDTLVPPLTVLNPTSPVALTNSAGMGGPAVNPPRPLTLRTKLTVAARGGSLFEEVMRNVVKITATVPTSTLRVDLEARLDEEEVLGLPLKYADDANCWLATVVPSSSSSAEVTASRKERRRRRRNRALLEAPERKTRKDESSNVFRIARTRRHSDGAAFDSDVTDAGAGAASGPLRVFSDRTSSTMQPRQSSGGVIVATASEPSIELSTDPSGDRPGIDLTRFLLTLPSTLTIDASCDSCTSPGLAASLPRVVSAFADAGWSDAVRPTLERTVEELVLIGWDDALDVSGAVERAPMLCHLREEYDPVIAAAHEAAKENGELWSSLAKNVDWDKIVLPRVAVQLGVTAIVWGAEASVLTLASTYSSSDYDDGDYGGGDPLSGQLHLESLKKSIADGTGDVDQATYVNFMESEEENVIGELILMAMEGAREYLSETGTTAVGQAVGGHDDLRANELIRESVLNEAEDDDGGDSNFLVLRGTPGEVLFDEFGASVAFDKVEVRGLDTLSAVDALDALGPQTLRNGLTFEQLSVTVDFNVTTGGGTAAAATERLTFRAGARDASVTFAALLAIDLEELSSVELGGIQSISDVLPCALSHIQNATLTQLVMEAGGLDGFFAGGEFLPGDVSVVAADAFESLKEDVRRALPQIFGSAARDIINSLMGRYRSDGTACEWERNNHIETAETSNDNIIDFRDLLLPPEAAMEYGGTGKLPYGNTFLTMYGMVDEKFLQVENSSDVSNESGASKINDLFGQYTEGQSGRWGSISLVGEDPPVDRNVTLALGPMETAARLAVWDVRLENVDSVGAPLELLRPVRHEPRRLNSTVSFGAVGSDKKPLKLAAKVLASLVGGDENEVEITATVPRSTWTVDLEAALSEEHVMGLPLKYVDDVNCWLATIIPSLPSGIVSPSEQGRRRQQGMNNSSASHHYHNDNLPPPGLNLTRFLLTLPSTLSIDAQCHSCVTPGLAASLPKVISAFTDAGWSNAARPRLELAAEKLVAIAWDAWDVRGAVETAPKLCPYREEYEPDLAKEVERDGGLLWTSAAKVDWDDIVLPRDVLQLGVAAAIWAGEAMALTLASTHASSSSDEDGYKNFIDSHREWEDDPLWGQHLLDGMKKSAAISTANSDVAYLSFTEPEGNVGELILMGMEWAREYVSEVMPAAEGASADEDLRANALINESILNAVENKTSEGDGNDVKEGSEKNAKFFVLHGTGDEILFEKFGASVAFDKAEVRGLDTLSTVSVFEALGPQTLRNGLTFERLNVTVHFNVTTSESGFSSSSNGSKVQYVMGEAATTVATVTEQMTFRMGARHVALSAAMLLAMDLDELSSIKLGGIRETSNILPCALSQVQNATVTQLSVQAGHLNNFFGGGEFVPKDVSAVASDVFEYMKEDVRRAIPVIFGSTVRDGLNSLMGQYRREGTACEWEKGHGRDNGLPLLAPSSSNGDDSGIEVDPETIVDENDFIDVRDLFLPPKTAPEYPKVDENDFIDFRDLFLPPKTALEYGGTGKSPYGDTLLTMFHMVDETLLRVSDGNNDTSKINELIRQHTESQSSKSGSVSIATDAAAMDGNVTLTLGLVEAVARVVVWDVRVENLDSVGEPLELLRPVRGQPRMLNSTVSFGVGSKPLRLAAKVLVSLTDGAEMQIRNELDLAIELSEASIQFGILLLLSERHLFSYPIRDVVNVYCWLVTLLSSPLDIHGKRLEGWSANLAHHKLSIEDLDLRVDCINCSSPYFGDFVSMLYAPPDDKKSSGTEDIYGDGSTSTGFVHDWAEYGKQFLAGDLLRDRILFDAAKQCPHNDAFDPNATASEFFTRPLEFGELKKAERDRRMMLFNVFSAVTAGLLFLLGGIAVCYIRRRNRIWIQSLSNENRLLLERHRREEREREDHMNTFTKSMARSECIPKRRRIFVPVALLANLGLFLGGHLGILSTVNVDAELAGEQFSIHRFLEFQFFSSGMNTWQNGGREMAIFCFVFSGLWPYIKLSVLAVLWFLPPVRLSVSNRKKVLMWMDTFAKLSIFDLATMLFFVAILLVFAGGPGGGFSADSDSLYYLKLIVVPGPAFYCFMIAQRISRSSSKYLLELQDEIEMAAASEYEEQHRLQLEQRSEGNIVVYEERTDSEYEYDDHKLQLNTTDSTVADSVSDFVSTVADSVSDIAEHEENESDTGEEHGETEEECDRYHSSQIIVRSCQDEQEANGNTNNETNRYCGLCKHLGGVAGYRFTVVTIFAIGIIGCALMPSISFDTKGLWNIVESANTFQRAATEYSVFEALSLVLLEARFVLDTTSDYVSLGFLLVVVLISAIIFPSIQVMSSAHKWWNDRRSRAVKPVVPEVELPQYVKRMYLFRHFEIFLVSFILAVWQLAAVSSYVLHFYCDLLGQLYDLLAYAGLTETSEVQCFRTQMSDPLTLVIIFGGFIFLLASFLYQAFAQYKLNKAAAMRAVQSHGYSERFSNLWKSERTKVLAMEDDEFSDELDGTTEERARSATTFSVPFSGKVKTELRRARSLLRRNEKDSSQIESDVPCKVDAEESTAVSEMA